MTTARISFQHVTCHPLQRMKRPGRETWPHILTSTNRASSNSPTVACFCDDVSAGTPTRYGLLRRVFYVGRIPRYAREPRTELGESMRNAFFLAYRSRVNGKHCGSPVDRDFRQSVRSVNQSGFHRLNSSGRHSRISSASSAMSAVREDECRHTTMIFRPYWCLPASFR